MSFAIAETVITTAPDVAASVLAAHDRDELIAWLGTATPDAAVAALHLIDAATAATLLYALEPARRDQILAAMPPRDCYRCLRVLDDERRTEILDALPATTRREVRRILAVPERSAAGLAEVQRILGHSSVATTVRYLHIADPERHRAMQLHPLNDWLMTEAA